MLASLMGPLLRQEHHKPWTAGETSKPNSTPEEDSEDGSVRPEDVTVLRHWVPRS